MSSLKTPYKTYDVSGQTVLVTGATAGIGEATALRFASLGCKLIIVGRRADRLESLKSTIAAEFGNTNVLAYTLVSPPNPTQPSRTLSANSTPSRPCLSLSLSLASPRFARP